jgi:membrane glycosyltransferase
MTRFDDDLHPTGAAASEIGPPPDAVRTWEDLQRRLDRHPPPAIPPRPKRVSISSPDLDRSWKRNLWKRRRAEARAGAPAGSPPAWERVVGRRQRAALALTVVATAGILWLSYLTLRAQQMPEAALWLYLAINGTMVFFMASNFFKLMLGTWHTLRGPAGNPWHPTHSACDPRPDVKVAIVFPVYHEDVARVAAGMAATWSSIAEQHPDLADRFDVFLLSDSRKLEYWIAEQAAVHRLTEAFPAGRFFYRRRPLNLNAKLGNIADFCRRWGRAYDHMLVMDADSVMDGGAVVSLLRMMEGNHRIGILQTNPLPILRKSLFGRMQQFAARLYGAVFSYSLQAMHMGHASYIGHNALIRLKPFIQHCILPKLPGPTPWGGKPLSHDIVESAMMARAGYEVWFLPDVAGSYEELPANILDFMVRERRWMQGNLQHLRFLFLERLRPIHRETFITGSMGYFAAPLWALFLVISAFGAFHFLENTIPAGDGLRMLAVPATMLTVSSMVFLFMPRLLALVVNCAGERARQFGGRDKLIWSMVLETVFSFVFSPLMMICITQFLWLWLRRRSISWDAQARDDEAVSWAVCLRRFGWISVLGLVGWVIVVSRISQIPVQRAALLNALSGGWLRPTDLVIWLFPILGGFTASVWIAQVTSFTFPWLAARRLFAIPEEIDPPAVVVALESWRQRLEASLPDIRDPAGVFGYALNDPDFYVRHRRETRDRPHVAQALLPKILAKIELAPRELFLALGERSCFDALHVTRVEAA